MRRRNGRRGVVAVEAALVLPAILVVLMAIIDLSMFMQRWRIVQRAARDGCRVGSVTIEGADATGDEIEAAAIEQAETMLSAAGMPCAGDCTVEADWELADDGYHYLTVTVSWPWSSWTGFFPRLGSEVTGRFTMLTQQQ